MSKLKWKLSWYTTDFVIHTVYFLKSLSENSSKILSNFVHLQISRDSKLHWKLLGLFNF